MTFEETHWSLDCTIPLTTSEIDSLTGISGNIDSELVISVIARNGSIAFNGFGRASNHQEFLERDLNDISFPFNEIVHLDEPRGSSPVEASDTLCTINTTLLLTNHELTKLQSENQPQLSLKDIFSRSHNRLELNGYITIKSLNSTPHTLVSFEYTHLNTLT